MGGIASVPADLQPSEPLVHTVPVPDFLTLVTEGDTTVAYLDLCSRGATFVRIIPVEHGTWLEGWRAKPVLVPEFNPPLVWDDSSAT